MGKKLIENLGKHFVSIQKPQVLFEMWTREKLSWLKFVRGYATEDEIKEKFLVPKVSVECAKLVGHMTMYEPSFFLFILLEIVLYL